MATTYNTDDNVPELIRAAARRLYTRKASNSQNLDTEGKPMVAFDQLPGSERGAWIAVVEEANELRLAKAGVETIGDLGDLPLKGKTVKETIEYYKARAEAAEGTNRAHGIATAAHDGDAAGKPFTKPRGGGAVPTGTAHADTSTADGGEDAKSSPHKAGDAPVTGQKR